MIGTPKEHLEGLAVRPNWRSLSNSCLGTELVILRDSGNDNIIYVVERLIRCGQHFFRRSGECRPRSDETEGHHVPLEKSVMDRERLFSPPWIGSAWTGTELPSAA